MDISKSIINKKTRIKITIVIKIVGFNPPFSEFLNSSKAALIFPFKPLLLPTVVLCSSNLCLNSYGFPSPL